MVEGYTS